MQCPVCGSPATDHTPPQFDGIFINCNTCGNYSIAAGYVDKLCAFAPDVRRSVLLKAKQIARFARPSIDRLCF